MDEQLLYMDILKLPLELVEKIFKFLNQTSLASTCLVNKQWNSMVYLVWHTIDLSKSRGHFTHLSNEIIKSISKHVKSNKIRILETICNNLISNNGFLLPPLSNKSNYHIFRKRNIDTTKDSNNNSNSSNTSPTLQIEGSGGGGTCSNEKIENIIQLEEQQQQEQNTSSSSSSNNIPIDSSTKTTTTTLSKKLQSKGKSGTKSKSQELASEIEIRVERRIDQFFKGICTRFERVEILDLSGCIDLKMDSIMMMVKSFSQTLKQLTTRRCKSPTITDEKFSEIFQYCRKLTSLSLGEMPLIGDKTIANVSLYCPNLEAIGLARCLQITDSSIICLSKASTTNQANNSNNSSSSSNNGHYSKLKTIGLNHLSHLSDDSILMLGLSCSKTLGIFSVCNLVNLTADTLSKIFLNCPNLGSIDLSGCENADDSVLESISFKCHNLFQLNISRLPKVSSSSLKLVAQHCKLLRILFMSKTMIDDDSIVYIVDNLNSLEILFASHCSNLTDESIKSVLNIGTERLSRMIVNFSSCLNISNSLLSILSSFTKDNNNSNNIINNNNLNNLIDSNSISNNDGGGNGNSRSRSNSLSNSGNGSGNRSRSNSLSNSGNGNGRSRSSSISNNNNNNNNNLDSIIDEIESIQ